MGVLVYDLIDSLCYSCYCYANYANYVVMLKKPLLRAFHNMLRVFYVV